MKQIPIFMYRMCESTTVQMIYFKLNTALDLAGQVHTQSLQY